MIITIRVRSEYEEKIIYAISFTIHDDFITIQTEAPHEIFMFDKKDVLSVHIKEIRKRGI